MLNLNSTTLQQVADQALVDAAAHPRWIAAIGRALVELDSNPWIERGDVHGLIIGSPSGKAYASNGVCQCIAFEHGQPCWHRAAARLVRLHDEAREAAQQPAERRCSSACATCPAESACATKLSRKIAAARIAAQFNAEIFG